jgi:diadenosine tetraphosphate (Ap4A) HIT family hydrolase
VLQNNGARAGQTAFHAHVHLVPKPSAASGLIVQGGFTAVDQGGVADELGGVADELRRRLAGPAGTS